MLRAFRPWVLNQPGRILTAYAIYTPSDGSSKAVGLGVQADGGNRADLLR